MEEKMDVEEIFKVAFLEEWEKMAQEGPFPPMEKKEKEEEEKEEKGKPSPFEKYKKKMKEEGGKEEKEEEEGEKKASADEDPITGKLDLFRKKKE